jgi:hypothetical protein
MFNQKFKVMKNLKQNLVKAILCLGVVSVSLMACNSDAPEDPNVITLDQLDDQLDQLDSTMNDPNVVEADSIIPEPVDDVTDVEVNEDVETEVE